MCASLLLLLASAAGAAEDDTMTCTGAPHGAATLLGACPTPARLAAGRLLRQMPLCCADLTVLVVVYVCVRAACSGRLTTTDIALRRQHNTARRGQIRLGYGAC